MWVLITEENLDWDERAISASWFKPGETISNEEEIFRLFGRNQGQKIEWRSKNSGKFIQNNESSNFKFWFFYVED